MITSEPLDLQINHHFATVNSLGNTVIIETFKAAAFYITHSNGAKHSRSFMMDLREGESCFMFIHGTGLQILIEKFGLAYNADNLLQTFNYCIRKSE